MAVRSKWVLQVDAAELKNTFKDRPTQSFFLQEKEWLKANPKIRFTGDPNNLPYEAFKADGSYIGMMAEHLKLIDLGEIAVEPSDKSINRPAISDGERELSRKV